MQIGYLKGACQLLKSTLKPGEDRHWCSVWGGGELESTAGTSHSAQRSPEPLQINWLLNLKQSEDLVLTEEIGH